MDDPKKSRSTYKDAGVDIEAGNLLARRLGPLCKTTHRPEVISGVGGFAGISAIPSGYTDPLLVSGTDGVGTKLKIAFSTGRHDTVGIDLVAMAVNDILTVGAEPLFFLDYFATGKLDVDTAEAVVRGIAEGCRQAGCTLLGGETAEMPGMYAVGEYDLAGFVVGVVERQQVIDGSRAQAGDAVIGLPSSGLHSNGFSLVRKVLLEGGADGADALSLEDDVAQLGRTLGAELLEPTRIYAGEVLQLKQAGIDMRALAHITGGGLIDNPPRCVPDDLAFRFDTSSWDVPAIMHLIAERGGVRTEEMRRTFNMGLGMIVVVPEEQAQRAVEVLKKQRADARVVGKIVARNDDAHEEVEFIQ